MKHQQRIRAVAAITKPVIREHPVMARLIGHRLNARKALDWLANERKGNARLPIAVHRTRIAHHGARCINPRITRTCKFTGNQRIPRCIRGRQDHGEGRQYRVPRQGRLETLVRNCRPRKAEYRGQ